MTRRQIRLVRTSWKTAGEEPLTLGILFYDQLFNLSPATRSIFRTPVSQQTTRLMQTVGALINKMDRLDDSIVDITRIADEYALQGLRAMDYPAIASALLWAMEKRLERSWSKELNRAWLSFYGTLSATVKESAGATPKPHLASRRYRLATLRPAALSYAS